MSMSSTDLIKRIGLAVIGYSLPHSSDLSSLVKDVRKGLLYTVVCGVLIAALVLLACFGFYHFLLTEGVSVTLAIVLCAFFLAMVSVITALIASKHMSRIERAKEKLTPFSQTSSESLGDLGLDQIALAFLEGFHRDPHGARRTEQRPPLRDDGLP